MTTLNPATITGATSFRRPRCPRCGSATAITTVAGGTRCECLGLDCHWAQTVARIGGKPVTVPDTLEMSGLPSRIDPAEYAAPLRPDGTKQRRKATDTRPKQYCLVTVCGRGQVSHGMCGKHSQQWRRAGKPDAREFIESINARGRT